MWIPTLNQGERSAILACLPFLRGKADGILTHERGAAPGVLIFPRTAHVAVDRSGATAQTPVHVTEVQVADFLDVCVHARGGERPVLPAAAAERVESDDTPIATSGPNVQTSVPSTIASNSSGVPPTHTQTPRGDMCKGP